MNQSILFPDTQSWDSQKQAVVFPVQVQGANLTCFIPLSVLTDEPSKFNNEADILSMFDSLRFELEDRVEELIETLDYDEPSGVIEIRSF